MRDLLVKHNSFNKLSVFEGPANLACDLDVFKINIFSIEISDGENGLNSDLSHVALLRRDHLGPKCSHSALNKLFVIVLLNIEFLCNFFDSSDSNIAGFVKSIGDFQGMDALFK